MHQTIHDRAQFYDIDKPPIFFSEDARKAIHGAFKKIAGFRAQETSAPYTFPSEEAYREHKKELNDREIVELLRVRHYAPEMIDAHIELMDN